MGTSVQPVQGDPVQAYLQKYGAPPPSTAQDLAQIRPKGGSVPLTQDLRDLRTQISNPVDAYLAKYGKSSGGDGYAAPGMLGTVQKSAEALVSGVPFAQRAVAGYRGLLELLGSGDLQSAANEVQHTLGGERQDVASLPAKARIPLQLLGSLPVAAELAPLGVVGGGAAFGAAAGADKDASSLLDRAKNTGIGGALGAAGAKIGQLGGKAIANVADRTGITDAVGRALSKVTPNISAAIGTEGQVNKVLGDRQDILDHLGEGGGSGQTAAEQQIARIGATKAQAKILYDAAHADQGLIQNPRLRQLLADPRVAKSYQAIAQTLDQSPRPLTSTSTNTVLSPRSGGLLSTDDVSSAAAQFDRLYGTGTRTPTVPDPRALSLLKRELYAVAQGKLESPLALKQEDARQLLPIVDEIRTTLHGASPAWQQADQFYAGAKGQEEAFAHGFDAFRAANNQTGDNLATNSPEAMLKAISEPRYPGEPATAQAERAAAFRAGAQSAASGAVKGAKVDRGISSILGANPLAPTQPGMQTRSLMFEHPDEAGSLEQLLARVRGESQAQPSGGNSGPIPVSPTGVLRYAARKLLQSPDLLETPKGQGLLTERLRDATGLQQGVSASRQGSAAITPLQEALERALGGQLAR